MIIDLGRFTISLLVIALLIPVTFSYRWKRQELRNMVGLFFIGIIMAVLYPITPRLSSSYGDIGYLIGKTIIFILLPGFFLFRIEKFSIPGALLRIGIQRKNLRKSLRYGLIAAVITITITVKVGSTIEPSLSWRIIMFLEAFTEEFYFRGILFFYLSKKLDIRVAYLTSVIGFVLIHPQHFDRLFILSTISQGILLAIVMEKTENIFGPWIAHGLNRNIPSLIRIALGM